MYKIYVTIDHSGNSCALLAMQMRISTIPQKPCNTTEHTAHCSKPIKTLVNTLACSKQYYYYWLTPYMVL